MNILLTGGAGYIGSHAVRRLLADGHRVLVVDDLRHGHSIALDAAFANADGRGHLLCVGIEDSEAVAAAIRLHRIEAVMHFPAFIEVGESVAQPLKYYRNNFSNAVALLEVAIDAGIRRFVFSSTAAVYGTPATVPIDETDACVPVNPYGRSKWMFELALEDARIAHGLGYTVLRYFNVAGASADASIGERHEPETHLIPRILDASLSDAPSICVFGDDYPTPDGTCVRDYVHVEDLVQAHALALAALEPGARHVYNLGSAEGFSVREVVQACVAVTARPIQMRVEARRAGDPPSLVSASRRIRDELGWTPMYPDMASIIRHAWQWQQRLARERAAGAHTARSAAG